MKLAEVHRHLDHIAPTKYAESWDNVGLLAGDPQQSITRGLLCIDYTPAVAEEAVREKCDLVIAYHPPIFKATTRVIAPSPIYDAIRRGIAIYSPHTALDVAVGGTNDVLADIVGIVDRQPLKRAQPTVTEVKLMTFVPEEHVEKVASALFDAGAGRIGDYTSCSFRTKGTGTFFGEQGTHPQVGEAGQLENVPEIKIETVVPIAQLSAVMAALRASHPYEEPAFDLVQLVSPPVTRGIGRIGRLAKPTPREQVFGNIKKLLQIDHLLIAGPESGDVKSAAVCAGACGDMLDEAIARKIDLYLTGEMRHHDALKAAQAGVTVVCTLHSNSERITLARLQERLAGDLPSVGWHLARADRDPFSIR